MNIVNAAEASLNTRSIIEPLQTTVQKTSIIKMLEMMRWIHCTAI